MKLSKDTFFAALIALLFVGLFCLVIWIGTVNHRADWQGIGGTW